MNTITFNNVNLSTQYGVFYDGSHLYDTPEKDVTFFSVPGKNGDLSISNERFNNIEIRIPCFIRTNFQQNFSNLVNYLYSQDGYGRLETSTEPDIFRSASFVSALEPDTGAFLKYGTFTLVFNSKPQKWLKSGETAISVTSSETLVNPTRFGAKPLIAVTGTGTINVGTSTFTLANNTSVTYIDCEIQDAYEGAINRNGDLTVTNGFPVLPEGNNSVSVTGCTIEITPRWWKL